MDRPPADDGPEDLRSRDPLGRDLEEVLRQDDEVRVLPRLQGAAGVVRVARVGTSAGVAVDRLRNGQAVGRRASLRGLPGDGLLDPDEGVHGGDGPVAREGEGRARVQEAPPGERDPGPLGADDLPPAGRELGGRVAGHHARDDPEPREPRDVRGVEVLAVFDPMTPPRPGGVQPGTPARWRPATRAWYASSGYWVGPRHDGSPAYGSRRAAVRVS